MWQLSGFYDRFRYVWRRTHEQFWRKRAQFRYLVAIRILRPYKFTYGFEDFDEFDRHYPRHGREHESFGRTAFSYARFADRFCGGPADPNRILEHVKRDGTIIRCDPHTRIIGVLHANGFLGTCHKKRDAQKWFEKQQTL